MLLMGGLEGGRPQWWKALTLDFPVRGVYAVVVKSNPSGGFQGTGEASDIGKVHAWLGGRLNDRLAAHNWKRQSG